MSNNQICQITRVSTGSLRKWGLLELSLQSIKTREGSFENTRLAFATGLPTPEKRPTK